MYRPVSWRSLVDLCGSVSHRFNLISMYANLFNKIIGSFSYIYCLNGGHTTFANSSLMGGGRGKNCSFWVKCDGIENIVFYGYEHLNSTRDRLLNYVLDMGLDKIILWRVSERKFTVTIAECSEWRKNIHSGVHGMSIWFTDRSKINTGTGAVCGRRNPQDLSIMLL